jgi:hypothetical protein
VLKINVLSLFFCEKFQLSPETDRKININQNILKVQKYYSTLFRISRTINPQ